MCKKYEIQESIAYSVYSIYMNFKNRQTVNFYLLGVIPRYHQRETLVLEMFSIWVVITQEDTCIYM